MIADRLERGLNALREILDDDVHDLARFSCLMD